MRCSGTHRSDRRGPGRLARTTGAVATVLTVAAAGPASAGAAPVAMRNQQAQKTTPDGWVLGLTIDGENVNAVPNLAGAANSREAFVTLTSTATAAGGGPAITDSAFISGYQLGCQSDVSSGLGIGGIAAGGANVAAAPSILDANGSLTGFAQTVIQPGVITDLPMSNMALGATGRAVLAIENIHVKADACGGNVTIRSYAYLRISTAEAHSSVAVYGDPIGI